MTALIRDENRHFGSCRRPLELQLNTPQEVQNHLIELETKIAHQEVAIDELKTTVFEQHLTIEKLEASLKRITDRLEAIDSGAPVGPGNEKPPHY